MIPEATTPSSSESFIERHRAELTRLRAHVHLLDTENVRLRAVLAQAEAQLAEGRLVATRAALEPDIRAAFGLPPEAPLNWQAVAQWCAGAATSAATAPPHGGGHDVA